MNIFSDLVITTCSKGQSVASCIEYDHSGMIKGQSKCAREVCFDMTAFSFYLMCLLLYNREELLCPFPTFLAHCLFVRRNSVEI